MCPRMCNFGIWELASSWGVQSSAPGKWDLVGRVGGRWGEESRECSLCFDVNSTVQCQELCKCCQATPREAS